MTFNCCNLEVCGPAKYITIKPIDNIIKNKHHPDKYHRRCQKCYDNETNKANYKLIGPVIEEYFLHNLFVLGDENVLELPNVQENVLALANNDKLP